MDGVWLVAMWLLCVVGGAHGSVGDRSMAFQRCMSYCKQTHCLRLSDEQYAAVQPTHMRLLGWTCPAECDYTCMWSTVDAFIKDGSRIPQFHGKWPFIRLLGIQEPASVIFSFLNGLGHVVGILMLRKQVSSAAPLYWVWHLYALIGVNAWLWAVVFHARDMYITELMDYVCAVSLVTYSLFALCMRVTWRRRAVGAACGVGLLAFYVRHVHYLTMIHFDYGYNMKVNIAVGLVNSVGWLWWCSAVRRRQRYAWKAAACVLAVNLLVLLELGDFPPYWWTLDAHSLWHAGTAPISFFWYSFLIDDGKFMSSQQESPIKSGDSSQGDTATSNTPDKDTATSNTLDKDTATSNTQDKDTILKEPRKTKTYSRSRKSNNHENKS